MSSRWRDYHDWRTCDRRASALSYIPTSSLVLPSTSKAGYRHHQCDDGACGQYRLSIHGRHLLSVMPPGPSGAPGDDNTPGDGVGRDRKTNRCTIDLHGGGDCNLSLTRRLTQALKAVCFLCRRGPPAGPERGAFRELSRESLNAAGSGAGIFRVKFESVRETVETGELSNLTLSINPSRQTRPLSRLNQKYKILIIYIM